MREGDPASQALRSKYQHRRARWRPRSRHMIRAPPLRAVPLCAGRGARLQARRERLDRVWALPPACWARVPTPSLARVFPGPLLRANVSPDPVVLGSSVPGAGP